MNLLRPITDNITEVLVMILEFTQTRQKILVQNIQNARSPGFVPIDLTAGEFSNLLNGALDEHIRNQRLVFRDTENVKFGMTGSFEARPVVDENAKELLEGDRDEYLEAQISKLFENSLNQRIAAELLRQRQGTAATVDSFF
jgi:flagellar basal body rod protein FlgB